MSNNEFNILAQQFAEIIEEWDKAEKLIKLAERVRGEVIFASINELRYGGRRLVDALKTASNAQLTEVEIDAIKVLILECKFDCQRAQHDAVDALVLFLQKTLKAYEVEFGAKLLAEKYPSYYELKGLLDEADDLIIESREDRQSRQKKYDRISESLYPKLLTYYRQLRSSREVFHQLIEAQKLEKKDSEKRHWQQIWFPILAAFVLGGLTFSGISKKAFAFITNNLNNVKIEQNNKK